MKTSGEEEPQRSHQWWHTRLADQGPSTARHRAAPAAGAVRSEVWWTRSSARASHLWLPFKKPFKQNKTKKTRSPSVTLVTRTFTHGVACQTGDEAVAPLPFPIPQGTISVPCCVDPESRAHLARILELIQHFHGLVFGHALHVMRKRFSLFVCQTQTEMSCF